MHTPPRTLTVLHVSQPVEAGVANMVAELVGAQVRAGHRVAVACPRPGTLPGLAGRAGATVHGWPADRSPGPGVPAEAARLRRILDRVRPDLVHLHSAKAGLVGRLVLRGALPTVFQPHCWSFCAVHGPVRRAALGWERTAARWADRIVCVSRGEHQQGTAAGIAGRYVVVPNGIDPGRYGPPADPTRLRRDHDIPRAAPLAVCAGRLCRQKGQDVLLAAWPAVRRRLPGAHLVLVGDGPDRAALARQAPPGVTFAGPVGDPTGWYHAADLVVVPSRWEAMALVPLEAMACGRPVVTTDVPGARETSPPGHPAPVPVADPAALAAAVTALLADPARRADLGHTARAFVHTHFPLHHTTAQIEQVYVAVIPR